MTGPELDEAEMAQAWADEAKEAALRSVRAAKQASVLSTIAIVILVLDLFARVASTVFAIIDGGA